MDLLERARLPEELDGELAATATGGRVALVAGEAGIGKSALVRRFTERHAAGWPGRWPTAARASSSSPPSWTSSTLGARRRLFDPVGRYNRPDVLRLVVDDRPKPHLVSLAGAGGGRAASGTGPPGPG